MRCLHGSLEHGGQCFSPDTNSSSSSTWSWWNRNQIGIESILIPSIRGFESDLSDSDSRWVRLRLRIAQTGARSRSSFCARGHLAGLGGPEGCFLGPRVQIGPWVQNPPHGYAPNSHVPGATPEDTPDTWHRKIVSLSKLAFFQKKNKTCFYFKRNQVCLKEKRTQERLTESRGIISHLFDRCAERQLRGYPILAHSFDKRRNIRRRRGERRRRQRSEAAPRMRNTRGVASFND